MKTPTTKKLTKKIIMRCQRCLRCDVKLTKTNCMFIAYNPKVKNSDVGCCYKCVSKVDYLKLKPYNHNESFRLLPGR